MTGASRRTVVFLCGEHGLGKTSSMIAALARHGEPHILDPARHHPTKTPVCLAYGRPDDQGLLPAVQFPVEGYGVRRRTRAELHNTNLAITSYIDAGHAQAETSLLVAHRASNALPGWLTTAAQHGWDVHLAMLHNPELARQRRTVRYALDFVEPMPLAYRQEAKLRSAAGRLAGMLRPDVRSSSDLFKKNLIPRMVDTAQSDLRATERMYTAADQDPDINAHQITVAPDDTPDDVARMIAAAANVADVLGPTGSGRGDQLVADRRGHGRPPLPGGPEDRPAQIVQGLDSILGHIDAGWYDASDADLAYLEETFEKLSAELEAHRPDRAGQQS